MEITCRKQGSRVTAALSGELDHHTAPKAREALERAIKPAAVKELVLDLSGITMMDSSGIGVIIGRYRSLSRRGGSVSICGASAQIGRILKMAGLGELIA